jgi:hypothetical protein
MRQHILINRTMPFRRILPTLQRNTGVMTTTTTMISDDFKATGPHLLDYEL